MTTAPVFLQPSRARAFRPVLRRDPCAYCHQPDAGTLDHIRPRRRVSRKYRHGGGANSLDNLTGACQSCNTLKDDRPLLLFLVTHRYPLPQQSAYRT